jgi:DNA polymerase III delta prime subunit
MIALADTPYLDPGELLDDQIRIVRARLDQLQGSGTSEPRSEITDLWPAAALVDRRLRASDRARLPIAQLHASFRLTKTEACVLWVLIAHELCPRARSLVRELNTEQLADPSTDVLRRIVFGDRRGSHASWAELAEDGTLRRLGLIERTDNGAATPLHRQTWKVAERVLALVHGEVALDPMLAKLATLRSPAAIRDLVIASDVLERLSAATDQSGVVVAYGGAGSGRRSVLEAVIAERGRRVLQIDGRSIAKERDLARVQLRGLARECVLLGLVPLVRDLDALAATGDVPDRLDLVEAELMGLVVGTASRTIARHWRRATTQVELEPLSGDQCARAWFVALPMLTPTQADDLATLYPLAPGLIQATGIVVRGRCGDAAPTADEIADGLRSILDDRLAGLATRVVVTQTWEDIVLPEDQLAAVVELMARIRERRTVYERWGFAKKLGKGLGVAALFSGPPGTGKTMAAGLIARDLGVEMYQVDLSKIVSKWIGETEKNLAALFDAAEAGHAILLFDEADALFGKRTDVKSSNDRYANQEVNFLLQRLESYSGIVLLTTNHETSIDEAFRRRLATRVQFPMPEADERLRLWRTMLPKSAPTEGRLGLDQLAEHYVMSGGYIRNAVLRAAFLAAAERTPITAGHLASAARLEYEAMGKLAANIQGENDVRSL